jgi:hypothetical protein
VNHLEFSHNPICALAVNCPDIISVNRTKLPAACTATLRKSPVKKRFFLTATRCLQPVFMSKTSGHKELYTTKIGCFHQTPPGKTPFFYEVFWEKKSNALLWLTLLIIKKTMGRN